MVKNAHALAETAGSPPTDSTMDSLDVHRWVAFRNITSDYKPLQQAEMLRAHKSIIDALAAGTVAAFGCRPRTATHSDAEGVVIEVRGVAEMIPAATFMTPGITITTHGTIQLRFREPPEPGALAELPLYLSLRFRTEDVLKLWPMKEPAGKDAIPPPELPASVHAREADSRLERASNWMRQNVTRYVAKQRDDRVAECMVAVSVRKEVAKAGWAALPETIKGRSRKAN